MSGNVPGSSRQIVQAEPPVPVRCKLSASARDFTEQCLAIILDYRENRRSKGDAIESLVRVVMSERDRGTRDRIRDLDRAFPVYLDMLDDFRCERDSTMQAGVVGRQNVGSKKGVADTPREGSSSKVRSVRGRDEDTEQDRSRKRRAIDARIPTRDENYKDVPRDLRRTLELAGSFAVDPVRAVARVLSSPTRPVFPTSLWGDVRINDFVDLDRVFDFYCSTISAISDTTKVERHVRSWGDWFVAWGKYKAAILFAFPHREEELSIYGAHIGDTFLAVPAAPDLVLMYDIRVRTRVSESSSIRLSDLSLFTSYFMNIVVNFGTLGGRSTVSTPAAQERSSEICRRFNFGSCRGGRACLFRHACLKCRRRGHNISSCTDGGTTGARQRK